VIMSCSVQISTMHSQNTASLWRLQQKLEACGIRMPHPLNDGFIFTRNSVAPGVISALWTPYSANIDYFETLKDSDAYIVYNADNLIDPAMARGILFAMLEGKPIIMANMPKCLADVSTLAQHIIEQNIDNFSVIPMHNLEDKELGEQLQAALAAKYTYNLSASDKVLARSILRAHFRDLLPQSTGSEHMLHANVWSESTATAHNTQFVPAAA
jgi:hypothetical protein